MRAVLLGALTWLACLGTALGEPVLTLEEAVKLALEGNRKVLTAELEVARNQHLLSATGAQRLPNFSFSVTRSEPLQDQTFVITQGALGDFPATGPIPAQDQVVARISDSVTILQGQVAQPLTGLYKLNLAVDAQEAELEVARQQSRAQKLTTVTDVKTAYYGLVDTQAALDAALDSVEFLTEFERVVGEQVKEKAALKADLLDVRSRRLDAEAQALSLTNAITTQREQFNILLGRDLGTPFRVVNPLSEGSPPEPELAGLQARALEHRPELRVADLRVRQAEDQRDMKAADWIPEVNLALRYQRIFNSGILPGQAVSLELQSQWEPWDWGRRDQSALADQKAVEQALQSQADAQAQVVAEVNARFRKLGELRASEQAARVNVEAAEERLRVTSNRFL
ncbi:MAG: TolC family protein, partial [Candidatus Eremiobacterota bacterium]